MWVSVRSSEPHPQMTSMGSYSLLKCLMYLAVKAWPTASRRAVQNVEREGGGLTFNAAAQSGWLNPSGGFVRARRYACDERGLVCHSRAHCSRASALDLSFWNVAVRTFLTATSSSVGCAHCWRARCVAWQNPLSRVSVGVHSTEIEASACSVRIWRTTCAKFKVCSWMDLELGLDMPLIVDWDLERMMKCLAGPSSLR